MSETLAMTEDLEAAEQPAAAGGRSFLARLKIPLFVVAVVGVECAAAYLYLPSPGDTAVLAGVPEKTAPEPVVPAEAEKTAADESAGQAEVNLGEFSVTAFQPVSNTTLRIDFHLFGTVPADSLKEFQRLMEENKHRFRDQVLVTVRSAEITDLTDAGLGLVKRKILDRTNRTLGKPLLQTVVFSDFSFVEQ